MLPDFPGACSSQAPRVSNIRCPLLAKERDAHRHGRCEEAWVKGVRWMVRNVELDMDNSTAPTDHAATNPQDHAAYLWITSINCLSCSLCLLAARCYVKRSILGADDILICAAQV